MITAAEVSKKYTEWRRMIHPNYSPHPRWRSDWEKTAEMLNDEKIPVGSFIEAQFRGVRPFPMPNQLAGPKALERYDEISPDVDDEAVRRFAYEVDYVEVRSKILSMHQILSDEPSTLSPVFRYCLAYKFNLHDLVEHLREAALRQLQVNSPSRGIYVQWIPPELLEAEANG